MEKIKLPNSWFVIVNNQIEFDNVLAYMHNIMNTLKDNTSYSPIFPFKIGMKNKKRGYFDAISEYGLKYTYEDFLNFEGHTPQFEIGKWYKYDRCYIKFLKLENCSTFNELYYSEKILDGKVKKLNNYWANSLMEKTALHNGIVPIEEIQQYLPAGHPDLIVENFILPEKWCIRGNNKKLLDWRENNKCNVEFRYKHYYYPRNKSNLSEWTWNEKRIPNGYTEITFEQFKKYVLSSDTDIDKSKAVKKFELPLAWHVVTTKDNVKMLSKWRGVKLDVGKITGIYENGNKEHNPLTSTKGFGKEITTEQFKQYVLKETVMEESKKVNDKKAIKVTTQKQWNFILKQYNETLYGADILTGKTEYGMSIPTCNHANISHYQQEKYQILSFQEWLDENGYVFKEEFKVGDWITYYHNSRNIKVTDKIKEWGSSSYCTLENKQQPFKDLLRKATQEEINEVQNKSSNANEMKSKDDYCVKVTKDNIAVLTNWYKLNDSLEIGYTVGIRGNYQSYSSNGSTKYWAQTLSTEAFYKKIGHKEIIQDNILKQNQWYHTTNGKTLFYNDKHYCRYGFDSYGIWCTELGSAFDKTATLANRTEVEKRLLEEANRRYTLKKNGIRDTKIKTKWNDEYKLNSSKIHISNENGDPYGIRGGGACLYSNGKWVEVIEKDESQSLIPEYIECIKINEFDYGTNTIGQIYKVTGDNKSDWFIKGHPSVSKHRFKSSTKEAYEKQFVNNSKPNKYVLEANSYNVIDNPFNKEVKEPSKQSVKKKGAIELVVARSIITKVNKY